MVHGDYGEMEEEKHSIAFSYNAEYKVFHVGARSSNFYQAVQKVFPSVAGSSRLFLALTPPLSILLLLQ